MATRAPRDRREETYRRYGLTSDAVGWMLRDQSARCWIGRERLLRLYPVHEPRGLSDLFEPPKVIGWELHERFHFDHCHHCGEVRGLLCPGCNTELRWVEYGSAGCYPKRALDPVWVAAAEAYLAAHACMGRWDA